MLCHQQINEIRHASDKKSFNIHDEFVPSVEQQSFYDISFLLLTRFCFPTIITDGRITVNIAGLK
jgi:hypothetical protein